jgi:hypothetical protein
MKFLRSYTILAFLWCFGYTASSQNIDTREDVYLSVNSSHLLAGETLRYSAFVLDKKTGKPSQLSQLLYVELIDRKGEAVFRHKLLIEKGQASADFFIPTLLHTDSYQLIAFSQWMRNFDDYFNVPVIIINPYENPGDSLLIKSTQNVVKVYPEGGAIIGNHDNRLVIKAVRSDGLPVSLPIRLVDDQNSTIAMASTDQTGYGTIEFKAEHNRDYQLIYEDGKGAFQFTPLEMAKPKAASLRIQKASGRINIMLKAAEEVKQTFRLSIDNSLKQVFEDDILTNQDYDITTANWQHGIYRARVMQGNLTISERIFYVGEASQLNIFSPEELITHSKDSVHKVWLTGDQIALATLSIRKNLSFENKNRTLRAYRSFGMLKGWENIPQTILHQNTIDDFLISSNWKSDLPHPSKNGIFAPEIRGEVFCGDVLFDNETPKILPLIAYGITGQDFQLNIAQPDSLGHFYIQVPPQSESRKAYFSLIMDTSKVTYRIHGKFLDTYPKLAFPDVRLTDEQIKEVAARSVNTQIMNAYYQADSNLSVLTQPSDFDYDFYYTLDDYNRFPLMYEHFYEYVPYVSAKSFSDKIKIHIRNLPPNPLPPLILIDGVPTDSKRILDFSPYRVQSFGIINHRFFYGPMVSDGVLVLHTFEGDLQGFEPGHYSMRFDYKGVQRAATPLIFDWNKKSTKIPRYQEELIWMPNWSNSTDEKSMINFGSSQVPGMYTMKLEGIDKDGSPVSISKSIAIDE